LSAQVACAPLQFDITTTSMMPARFSNRLLKLSAFRAAASKAQARFDGADLRPSSRRVAWYFYRHPVQVFWFGFRVGLGGVSRAPLSARPPSRTRAIGSVARDDKYDSPFKSSYVVIFTQSSSCTGIFERAGRVVTLVFVNDVTELLVALPTHFTTNELYLIWSIDSSPRSDDRRIHGAPDHAVLPFMSKVHLLGSPKL
jgi:hypothetical protein